MKEEMTMSFWDWCAEVGLTMTEDGRFRFNDNESQKRNDTQEERSTIQGSDETSKGGKE